MDTSVVDSSINNTVNAIVNTIAGAEPLKIAMGLAIIIIGIILVRFIVKRISKFLDHYESLKSVQSILCTAIHFVLDLIVILCGASTMGIPITTIIALVSVVGLAISLAVQGLLTNLADGFIILISHPFQVGDFIESGTIMGTVTEIGIMHTRILTKDGRQVFIPNSLLYSANLTNYSASTLRRVELSVSASYNNSPDEVRAAIFDAIHHTDHILPEPPPAVNLEAYGDHSINYSIWVWVKGSDYLSVKYPLNERLYQTFKNHGVEMTYPHLNVHMKNN